jgi:NAD(P)-dependent dehydrogenase (short-subunit alcohol dehydrogenase family)
MTQLLTDRSAVVHGAGGHIGGAVAAAFAREGATVYLAGRTEATLRATAEAIAADGGRAEVAVVDARDEAAVDALAERVVAETGRLDVSFNAVDRGDVQGALLLDMPVADYVAPAIGGLTTNLITARAAARRMAALGTGGAILTLTSASSATQGPMMGGTGAADAAVEQFIRTLASEAGRDGVRVLGIWTAGVAESLTDESIAAVWGEGAPTAAQAVAGIAAASALGRAPRLAEVAETAAFLASDRASGITGTMVNVTCGLVLR